MSASHSDRASTIASLDGAIDTARSIMVSETWPFIERNYLSRWAARTGGSSDDIYAFIMNPQIIIVRATTAVYRSTPSDPWNKHFHAVIFLTCHLGDDEFVVKLSHAGMYLIPSIHDHISRDSVYMRRICDVRVPSTMPIEELMKLTISHWFAVNAKKSLTSWPTSCTGFTDFILYALYQSSWDVLDICPLTVQNGTSHTIYNRTGIIPVPAGDQIIIGFDQYGRILWRQGPPPVEPEVDEDDDEDMGPRRSNRLRR